MIQFRFAHKYGKALAENLETSSGLMVLATLAAIGGEVVFRLVDWTFVQITMRNAMVLAGINTGQEASTLPGVQFSFGSYVYDMTSRCTYADFLCLTTPLLLRFNGIAKDITRLLIWWFCVFLFTFFRIYIACTIRHLGIPWWLAHDSIDYIFRIVALLTVIYWWLQWRIAKKHT